MGSRVMIWVVVAAEKGTFVSCGFLKLVCETLHVLCLVNAAWKNGELLQLCCVL